MCIPLSKYTLSYALDYVMSLIYCSFRDVEHLMNS